ncbi:MAG: secretion protein HlyD [Deltaproteobacteria bacterium]|nr:secretion protein HlyD [Deltaproteobacteria bacterium]
MKRILVFVLLLAAAAGGWLWWTNQEARRRSAPLEFHGNIDIREVRLGFRVSGRVREVLKEEGDPVRSGEIVARLDDEPFRNAVDQARAQVGALEARLEELKNGTRPEEIDRARKNLAATEAARENARIVFTRQQRLLGQSVVAQQDFDTARTALDSATAQRDAARAALDLALAGARDEQIAQAKANLEAARAALAQAQTQLGDTVLAAPEEGVVLTRAVEPGSIVQAGSIVLTESLLAPVRARAYAPEPRLGLIHPGREVLVFTDSRPEPYHGRIGDVSPRAEFTPKTVETTELRTALVYRFRVLILDADQGLRQGMPITVRLNGSDTTTSQPATSRARPDRFGPKTAEAAELPAGIHRYPVFRSDVVQAAFRGRPAASNTAGE